MNSDHLARHLVVVVTAVVAGLIAFMLGVMWYASWSGSDLPISYGGCNIAVIPIQGDIVAYQGDNFTPIDASAQAPVSTSGDWVEGYLTSALADPNIRGVLVQIDSYGGLGAASAQMMSAFKRADLPVAAYIREAGTSGAYLAATGANTIIASPFASVGSIGVTYSYIENSRQNTDQGLQFVQLSSGPFKDTGNPNKPLTDAERKLYERDLSIYKDIFVSFVAQNRHLATSSVETLADGSIMPAQIALEKGLIDAIGGEEIAKDWFAEVLGMPREDIRLCK